MIFFEHVCERYYRTYQVAPSHGDVLAQVFCAEDVLTVIWATMAAMAMRHGWTWEGAEG